MGDWAARRCRPRRAPSAKGGAAPSANRRPDGSRALSYDLPSSREGPFFKTRPTTITKFTKITTITTITTFTTITKFTTMTTITTI